VIRPVRIDGDVYDRSLGGVHREDPGFQNTKTPIRNQQTIGSPSNMQLFIS